MHVFSMPSGSSQNTHILTGFRNDAQQQLFRHSSPRHGQHAKFLHAIIASPKRLGPMVKSCILRMSYQSQGSSEMVLIRDAAAAALPLMCNLTTLRMTTSISSTSFYIPALLHCSSQLDVFEFGTFKGWAMVDPLLFEFLRNQPSLRHLTIHGYPDASIRNEIFRDDPKWCPNVVSLGAIEGVIDIFLAQHRHIEYLNLPYAIGTSGSSPLSSVKYLTILNFNDKRTCSYLRRMTSLVLLDVVYLKCLDISDMVYFLDSAPHLRHLILTKLFEETASGQSALKEARSAFSLRPTLMHVDISRSLHPQKSFDRFYAPEDSGEMRRSILPQEDVYAWNKFV
ncbi:hypothetical protein D9619_009495 [Psilocybe cf. subviscida]|uniref:FBD domain-containing protein n=1 Tax=Psilocybe cf. subviscida TaxID=2480587 RepID=A0A8H5FA61_9AGAR|nr:hypothetical protein D9619_009495 [Psilocybe cf. subviscida]